MAEDLTANQTMIRFMAPTPLDKIKAMSDTARGIIRTICTVGESEREDLRTKIPELLSPDVIFNQGTAPYPIL